MTIWIEPGGVVHTEYMPPVLNEGLLAPCWGWDADGVPIPKAIPWGYGYAVVLTPEQLRERYPRNP